MLYNNNELLIILADGRRRTEVFMNPWERIELADYETHMLSKDVFQLQTLNTIMLSQMEYLPRNVAVLGAAGGNGFEHLKSAETIYAIDIN